jgi:hypothetical protein
MTTSGSMAGIEPSAVICSAMNGADSGDYSLPAGAGLAPIRPGKDT